MGRASHPAVLYSGSRLRLVAALLLLLSVLAVLLAGCGPDAKLAASSNKSKLDAELTRAHTVAGVPAGRLAPIIARENVLAANTASGQDSDYQAAATGYSSLYGQVVALESTTPNQAQAMTSSDLSQLKGALAAAESSSIADVVKAARQFDGSVPQAQSMLTTAQTVKDYFSVDSLVLDQLGGVTQILPDYQNIQSLTKLVSTLTADLGQAPAQPHVLACATEGGEIASYGIVPAYFWTDQNNYPVNATNPVMVTPQSQTSPFYFSSWPTEALTAFKSATTADDFTALGTQVQGQLLTLSADLNPSALAQTQVQAEVMRYQSDVNKYASEVQANNAYLKSHQAKNKDVPDYTSVWFLTNNSAGYAPPDDFYPNVPDFKSEAQFTQSAAQDANLLSQAKTTADYLALSKTVQKQEQALSFPLLKAEAYYDTTTTLQALVNEGQSTTTDVTFAGVLYKTPNAYEYADDDLRYDKQDTVGIQDAMIRLDQAAYREGNVSSSDSIADYQAIENEAQMFIHNLSAMITNLAQMPKNNTARIAWSMTAHQTDLNLINYYGLQNTRVIVVSLREQKARLFEDGKLVVGADGNPYAFDVTTGSPDKPTVPGLHCALPPLKGPPGGDIFKSADPVGSPFYYKPTPVHYSFGYSLYGYFIHDGWWRDATEMGYLTNLPHYDPEAFDGGSHGCINFHYANGDMGKVYAFSSAGIPVIVY